MNSVRMLALSLCLVGLAACGPRPGDAPAAPETLTLAVQGMTCDGCVNFLTTDLAARPGVTGYGLAPDGS